MISKRIYKKNILSTLNLCIETFINIKRFLYLFYSEFKFSILSTCHIQPICRGRQVSSHCKRKSSKEHNDMTSNFSAELEIGATLIDYLFMTRLICTSVGAKVR